MCVAREGWDSGRGGRREEESDGQGVDVGGDVEREEKKVVLVVATPSVPTWSAPAAVQQGWRGWGPVLQQA